MTKKYKKVQSRKRCISLGIKLTSDCLFQLGEMKSELQKIQMKTELSHNSN